MSEASRYWKLVRIDAGGNRRIQQIPAAKSFYAQVFEQLTPDDDVPDADIQHQLLDLYRHSSGETALLAERCLLCFLSWILELGCLQLESAESEDSYIFTRVVGNWDEKFLVSVSLMDGVEVTLPPFAFNLERLRN